jgi:indolepyruvate ferredoxin oxidoreductase
MVERRRAFLTAYQDAAYAGRYVALVERVRECETRVGAGETALAEAVARYYFKLLACKDEYEVARLFVDPEFRRALDANFEGGYQLNFHVSLPWNRGAKPGDEPRKSRCGPWLMPAMKLLASFKFLRGTMFDPFGRSAERRQEKQLVADYEATIELILQKLDPSRIAAAIALASVPESIRGYGPVKERSIVEARARHPELLAKFAATRPDAGREKSWT